MFGGLLALLFRKNNNIIRAKNLKDPTEYLGKFYTMSSRQMLRWLDENPDQLFTTHDVVRKIVDELEEIMRKLEK